MLANRKALILSTVVLQASVFAWADPAQPQNTGKSIPPKTTVAPTPRFNYFDLHFPSEHEIEAPQSTTTNHDAHESISAKQQQQSLNLSPAQGLHLSQIDQKPALEYRLTDKSTVHFRIGPHGGMATTSWGF
jgi:hypothetical protein